MGKSLFQATCFRFFVALLVCLECHRQVLHTMVCTNRYRDVITFGDGCLSRLSYWSVGMWCWNRPALPVQPWGGLQGQSARDPGPCQWAGREVLLLQQPCGPLLRLQTLPRYHLSVQGKAIVTKSAWPLSAGEQELVIQVWCTNFTHGCGRGGGVHAGDVNKQYVFVKVMFTK